MAQRYNFRPPYTQAIKALTTPDGVISGSEAAAAAMERFYHIMNTMQPLNFTEADLEVLDKAVATLKLWPIEQIKVKLSKAILVVNGAEENLLDRIHDLDDLALLKLVYDLEQRRKKRYLAYYGRTSHE